MNNGFEVIAKKLLNSKVYTTTWLMQLLKIEVKACTANDIYHTGI